MKYGIMILSVLILNGCDFTDNKKVKNNNTVSQPIEIKELGTSTEQFDRYYQIYTLEGCEYIVVSPGNSHFTWGTHKGNCKNSIHKKDK
jgi:hypothetical protein